MKKVNATKKEIMLTRNLLRKNKNCWVTMAHSQELIVKEFKLNSNQNITLKELLTTRQYNIFTFAYKHGRYEESSQITIDDIAKNFNVGNPFISTALTKIEKKIIKSMLKPKDL